MIFHWRTSERITNPELADYSLRVIAGAMRRAGFGGWAGRLAGC